MDGIDLPTRVMWFIPVLLSLTVHEWAHAWAAWKLGDDTAKHLGRLTLNPLDHMDPVGTFLLPLTVSFGWAKPVPINPLRFRAVSMRFGIVLVAAAGPISNALIAVAAWSLLVLLRLPVLAETAESLEPIRFLLEMFVPINMALCVFNLLPIPPLDGSKVVDGLLPDSARPAWNRFCDLGPALLAALILLPLLVGFSPVLEVMDFVTRLVE